MPRQWLHGRHMNVENRAFLFQCVSAIPSLTCRCRWCCCWWCWRCAHRTAIELNAFVCTNLNQPTDDTLWRFRTMWRESEKKSGEREIVLGKFEWNGTRNIRLFAWRRIEWIVQVHSRLHYLSFLFWIQLCLMPSSRLARLLQCQRHTHNSHIHTHHRSWERLRAIFTLPDVLSYEWERI